jgi:hypothetical protein
MKTTIIKTGKTVILLIVAATAAILSCSAGTEPTNDDRDGIVVQAYLFAGRPVNDVRLLHLKKTCFDTLVEVNLWDGRKADTTITLVRDSTVDNAMVTISTNGISYNLAFLDSGRYIDTCGNIIQIGQTYRIDINSNGKHVWAQTTVPSPTGGLSVSRDTLYSYQGGGGGGKPYTPDKPKKLVKEKEKDPPDTTNLPPVEIPDSLQKLIAKWNNPHRSILYFRCAVDSNLPYQFINGSYVSTDSLKISTKEGYTGHSVYGDSVVINLSNPGRYKLLIYTTTPDYHNMLETFADSMHQDLWSRSPTNINNGLGFFTSFSSDTVSFTIVGIGNGNSTSGREKVNGK